MDMKKYHDETLKKLEKMSDEEFYRVLKKVCGTNYEDIPWPWEAKLDKSKNHSELITTTQKLLEANMFAINFLEEISRHVPDLYMGYHSQTLIGLRDARDLALGLELEKNICD